MHATATVLTIAIAAAVQQAPAQQPAENAQVRVCGEVTARRTLTPGCDVVLHVKSAGQEYDVFIPASLRKDLSTPPERLRGAQVCFTGLAGPPTLPPRMRVLTTSGVEIIAPPPGLQPSPTAVVPCGGAVTMPRVITEAKPAYTRNAMRERVEGTVEVEAVVDIDGRITEARVIRPLHPELDEQAIAAVKEWRFVPGAMNGTPVPVVVDIELTFKIKQ